MHLGQRMYTIQHACTLIINTQYVRIQGEEDPAKSAAVLQHFFLGFQAKDLNKKQLKHRAEPRGQGVVTDTGQAPA